MIVIYSWGEPGLSTSPWRAAISAESQILTVIGVLGSVMYSTNFTIHLRRDLTHLVGGDDANILIANMNENEHLLASLGPVVGLARLARAELSRHAYLTDIGAVLSHAAIVARELGIPAVVGCGNATVR